MDRAGWMWVRLLARPVVVIVGSMLVALQVKQLGPAPPFGQLASFAPWIFLVGGAVGLIMVAGALWRVHRWEQGHDPSCANCGGPLGDLQDGRWGPFYRCLGCGAAINERRVG